MKKKSFYICFVLLSLAAGIAYGQRAELNHKGTSMANFLKVGVGARAVAMGDAFVAVSDDISALYWNPGGIGELKKNEAILQITDWLLDTKLYFFGISFRKENLGTFGISVNSFSSGDIEETTIREPEGTGVTFSASDIAAGFTFSRQLTDRFTAGITLKYISESLGKEKASTLAIDVGSIFETNFFNDTRFGISFSNLGGRMKLSGTDLTVQYLEDPGIKYIPAQLETDSWDIPLLFRFGTATDIIRKEFVRLTFATEVMDTRDFNYRIKTGGELALKNMLFLRGGYKFNFDQTNLTLGAGFNLVTKSGIGMKIDYAYSDYGLLNYTQVFSAIFTF